MPDHHREKPLRSRLDEPERDDRDTPGSEEGEGEDPPSETVRFHGATALTRAEVEALRETVRIEAHDRAGLERLLRYCARPPFTLNRLQWQGSGARSGGRGPLPAASPYPRRAQGAPALPARVPGPAGRPRAAAPRVPAPLPRSPGPQLAPLLPGDRFRRPVRRLKFLSLIPGRPMGPRGAPGVGARRGAVRHPAPRA